MTSRDFALSYGHLVHQPPKKSRKRRQRGKLLPDKQEALVQVDNQEQINQDANPAAALTHQGENNPMVAATGGEMGDAENQVAGKFSNRSGYCNLLVIHRPLRYLNQSRDQQYSDQKNGPDAGSYPYHIFPVVS